MKLSFHQRSRRIVVRKKDVSENINTIKTDMESGSLNHYTFYNNVKQGRILFGIFKMDLN